ncbi:lipid A-modifier LpxR family protein [Pseudooceanicola sp. LIPI14-2-Ac024]|uniref:lipid A-modifier LpxR family protein n=1 Tax=Pseudooceanicola sp. LIPI14-2-Ac024 TaxID=3344875 RepID=UPI0035D01250
MHKGIVTAAVLALAAPAAQAEGLDYIGHGRIMNNDVFYGGLDRWQTGSIASSHVWAEGWDGTLPTRFGSLIELRIEGRIIAPDTLSYVVPGDRPYANALSFGLHSHVLWRGVEVTGGADLVVTGDQTQLYRIQQAIHDIIDVPGPSDAVRAAGIGNGLHPTLSGEAGREVAAGPLRLRPFVEARWGIETYARAGFDLTLGPVGRGGLMVRDPVTGQRYRAVPAPALGYTLVLGADHAWVHDSTYLPAPHEALDRTRLRAGLHWEGRSFRGFYGLTWLSEEFAGQPEGQVIGSVRFDITF